MFLILRSLLLAILAISLFSSCSADEATKAVSNMPTSDNETTNDGLVIDIEHGKPKPVIDSLGWIFGIPNKLLLWDRRVDNHAVSPQTIEETADYLAENEVDGVKVRINQYDPLGEWKRLYQNDRVGLGWRATVGSVYTLGYSVLPGRLFGNDWYNPYTDSVHVYSDIPSLAMEQAAHAKDVHDRTHPGFYSAMQLFPFVGIVHEARSKQSVFEHVDEFGTLDDRAEARRVLMPQLGSEIGGQATLFIPQGDAIFQLTGAAIGHAVGRYEAYQITQNPTPERAVSFSSPLAEETPSDGSLLNEVSNALFSNHEENPTPYDSLFDPPEPKSESVVFNPPSHNLPSAESKSYEPQSFEPASYNSSSFGTGFTNGGFVDYTIPQSNSMTTPMD